MSTPPKARSSSKLVLLSTLMTSAPRKARSLPACGPAQTLVSSRTRTPSSGPPRDLFITLPAPREQSRPCLAEDLCCVLIELRRRIDEHGRRGAHLITD